MMLLMNLLCFSSTVFAESKTQMENGKQNKNAVGIRKEPQNTIDVLIAGDSLTYSSISPMGLWNHYGITSYVCGQPGQMMDETYGTLKLAFETQKPSLVLFETNVLFRKQERAKEKKDLMSKLYVREDSKGFKLRDGVKPYQKGVYMKKTEKKEKISKQVEMYMEKILKLCREHGARLVLVSTPSPKNYNYQKHNTLQEYAEKKSLMYLDMNLITKGLKINWKTDTMDKGDHLNLSGARKVTKYLGKYLKKEFGLSDHRNEVTYKTWDRMAREYTRKEEEKIKQMQAMSGKEKMKG